MSHSLEVLSQLLSEKFLEVTREVYTLSQKVESQKSEVETQRLELETKSQQILVLLQEARIKEAEIEQLKSEVEQLKSKIDPVKPPIEVSPNIEITIDSQTFRPGLDKDRKGTENRHKFNIGEIDALLDLKDDGQVSLALERISISLPTTAQTRIVPVQLKVGDSIKFNNDIRIHHHTRPRIVDNPSQPNSDYFDRFKIGSKLIPNYIAKNSLSHLFSQVDQVKKGQHPWAKYNNPDADPISEQYSSIVNSWVGGAGPLLNEAGMLMPVQVLFLLNPEKKLWNDIRSLADSSGNYAIHYRDKSGNIPRASNSSINSFPFLQSPDTITVKDKNGATLPIPDVAHQHSLTYLAYLLTGDRYYKEELEFWTGFNLLSRPKDDSRSKGIIYSGQVRSAAWGMRALLHSYLAEELSGDVEKAGLIKEEILSNIAFMHDRFVNVNSPEHRQTGVLSIVPFRPSPFLVNAKNVPYHFATWNHFVLSSVLNEFVRNGFTSAIPIRDHVLKVIEGLWRFHSSNNPYLIPWGNHAYPANRPDVTWTDIINATFQGQYPSTVNGFPVPQLTPDYVAWARAAAVSAVDASKVWAREALNWFDVESVKFKGGIPLVWQIDPV